MEAFFIGLSVILIGGLLTFSGYQFFRVLLPVWGLLAGFVWGAQGVAYSLGTGFLATGLGWFVGIIVGLIVAALAYFFYELAVGFLAASIGYWFTLGIVSGAGTQTVGFLAVTVGLIVGIGFALAAWYFKAPKGLIILLTAFMGSTAIIGGLLVMFGAIPVYALGTNFVSYFISESIFWSLLGLVIAIAGIVSQISLSQSLQAEMTEYDNRTYGTGMAGVKGGKREQSNTNAKEYEE